MAAVRQGIILRDLSYRKGLVVGQQRYWTRESEKARPRPGPRPMGVGAVARILHCQGWGHSCCFLVAPAFPAKDPVWSLLHSQPVVSFSSPNSSSRLR